MSTPPPPAADDQALVTAAQGGDLDAFNSIVERYQKHAYNLALRMLGDAGLAEDATQDAFLSTYRSIGRYRGGVLRSWILTIVANRCRDLLRSPHRRRTTSLEAHTEGGASERTWASPEPTPEEVAIRDELRGQVQTALGRLSAEHRLVVTLVDLQGATYEEVATIANVSLGTVKSRLSRARDRLRELLRPATEQNG